ncbi:hypothetical protein [Marisediminicola sp. LYQ134]|uniref:hypothetical protein n=1 Tax=Marisediminicola sp. LYQ134 TaxID=3391061 RepID=UPI003983010E
MIDDTAPATGSEPTSTAQDAPPPFADPRRIGALVGLVGACVFVFSYTAGFTDALSAAARIVVVVASVATLWFLFGSPRDLGRFVPARRWQIGVYLLAVVIEFVLIAVGSRWLGSIGAADLRPALIALAVGLHFIPFAWAFAERMFFVLGATLVALGAVGLLVGTATGALVAAVTSGVVMALDVLAYSLGMFARGR